MTTQLQQGQRLGSAAMHLWLQFLRGASGTAHSVGEGMARLAGRRVGIESHLGSQAAAMMPNDTVVMSELLAEAVRENSNLELDWLWLAGHLDLQAERSYCFGRALEINPACEQARRPLGGK